MRYNRVGREGPLDFADESFVQNPDGGVIACAATGRDEVFVSDLDAGACDRLHARPLFLLHRRPDLCAGWLTG